LRRIFHAPPPGVLIEINTGAVGVDRAAAHRNVAAVVSACQNGRRPSNPGGSMIRFWRRDNGALADLARLLSGDDTALVAEVTLALERPRDYVDRFAETLRWRGIDTRRYEARELPWIALVDGLIARKRLQEIDWRAHGHELADALAVIAGDEDWGWLASDEWRARTADERFAAIETRLAPKRLALVTVDIGGDCYPLMVLPLERLAEAGALAKRAGYGRIIPARDA